MILFKKNHTLKDMQKILDKELCKVRIIGDIPLSRNDFNYLMEKIKLLLSINLDYNLIEDYYICFNVFFVFLTSYDDAEKSNYNYFEQYSEQLPQYKRTFFYKQFTKLIDEYAISYLGRTRIDNCNDWYRHLILQAGIPEDYICDYFDIINKSNNFDEILDELLNNSVDKIKNYFRELPNKNRRQLIIDTIHMLQGNGDLQQSELINKYPTLPIKVINEYMKICSSNETLVM